MKIQIHTFLTMLILSLFYTSTVVPTISFTTDSTVVGEGDGAVEVCLKLSAPLSTDLEVVVTSTTGTGWLNLYLICRKYSNCAIIYTSYI